MASWAAMGRRALIAIAGAGIALGAPVALAAAAPGDLVVLSAGAPGPAFEPVLSADGAAAAFTADRQGGEAVLLADVAARTTVAVSDAGADTRSFEPAISGSGRHVAFATDADLGDGGDPDATDVYLRDVAARTTVLVSRGDGRGGPGGTDDSTAPAISADGRLVAFRSDADELSPDDDSVANVYVRDVAAGTTRLASRGAGDGGSLEPAISGDGRFVAFRSFTAEGSGVHVRDLARGTTTLVSRGTGASGAPLAGENRRPAVSADGRAVVFAGEAGVYVRDVAAATTTLVGPGGDHPVISADARRVAFVSGGRVIVRDLPAGRETVAWAPGEPATGPALSADGRFVAFAAGGRVLRRELGAVAPPAGGGGPGGGGPGGVEGGAADRTPPRLSLRLPNPQRLGRRVRSSVRCGGEPCEVTVAATIAFRANERRPRRLTPRRLRLAAGRRAGVRLAVPARTRRVLERALGRRAPVTITVTAEARDAAGNVAVIRLAALLRSGQAGRLSSERQR